jgi:hypothetical protein
MSRFREHLKVVVNMRGLIELGLDVTLPMHVPRYTPSSTTTTTTTALSNYFSDDDDDTSTSSGFDILEPLVNSRIRNLEITFKQTTTSTKSTIEVFESLILLLKPLNGSEIKVNGYDVGQVMSDLNVMIQVGTRARIDVPEHHGGLLSGMFN